MPLAKAKSGSRSAGHRTNSLAFAKHDCHTCAALKTECDRQRPRCGTCLSNERKCDGFAMPLVWKDLEVAQSRLPKSDTKSSQPWQRETLGRSEFKFVRGRAKRKRKPKIDIPRDAAVNETCFPVEFAPIETQSQDPTFVELIQSGKNQLSEELEETYSMFIGSIEYNQHCNLISNPQIKDESPEATVDNIWNNSPESIEVVLASDEIPTTVERETLISYAIEPSYGHFATDQATPMDLLVSESAEQWLFDQHFTLSPNPLHQDLTQKYRNILEMCKSCLRHDQTNFQRQRINSMQTTMSSALYL